MHKIRFSFRFGWPIVDYCCCWWFAVRNHAERPTSVSERVSECVCCIENKWRTFFGRLKEMERKVNSLNANECEYVREYIWLVLVVDDVVVAAAAAGWMLFAFCLDLLRMVVADGIGRYTITMHCAANI